MVTVKTFHKLPNIYPCSSEFKPILILLFFCLLLTNHVRAQKQNNYSVNVEQARHVATKFLDAKLKNTSGIADELQLAATYTTANGQTAFYAFSTTTGFVLVSADKRATPILGYSDESTFDTRNVPIQMEEYLHSFTMQLEYAIDNNIGCNSNIDRQWNTVYSFGLLSTSNPGNAVAPLLTANWGQGLYYNSMCPDNCQTGCVATAMGMIMHYWGYPSRGNDTYSYTPGTGLPTQSVNFKETEYDWDNMPNQLSSSSSQTEIEAVATLLWHCGVSVDMQYNVDASGSNSYNISYAMAHYFNYTIGQRIDFEQWNSERVMDSIKSSLDNACPLIYDGATSESGHVWVCDGYDASDMLHFNWGWDGIGNGYFALGAIDLTGHEYNIDNHAIFNLMPRCSESTTFTISTSSASTMGTVSGGGTYGCCDSCVVTATPNEYSQFDYWTEDGKYVSSNANYCFAVTENRQLVAHFSEKKTKIHASSNPFNGGVVAGNSNTTILSYDNGIVECAAGKDPDDMIWGVMFPAEKMKEYPGAILSKVSFWEYSPFHGEVFIYQGGDEEPDSLVRQTPFLSKGRSCFTEVPLLPPLDIDTSKNLWIVLRNYTGHFVAAYSTNNDNSNAHWNYIYSWNNIGIYGDWMIRGYLESIETNAGQTGSFWTGDYDIGDTCTLSAHPSEGITFENWTLGNTVVSTDSTFSFVVSDTANYVANFSINSYEITAVTNPPGIIDYQLLGGGTYNHGDICNLLALGVSGYVFLNWTKDGEVVSNPGWGGYSFTVTEPATYVANYYLGDHYAMASASPAEGGIVTGDGVFFEGDTIILTAIANPGYTFSQWSKKVSNYTISVSSEPTYSYVVTYGGVDEYIAEFTPANFLVSAPTSPETGGVVNGAGVYSYNSIATLTAVPNDSYVFSHWSDGATENPYNITITSDTTLTAFFVECPAPYELFDTVCDQYLWSDSIYTTSGDYIENYATALGCDSTVTLHLVVNYSYSNTISIDTTDSYNWGDSTYTTSGIYQRSLSTSGGCDSIVQLWLTLTKTLIVTDTINTRDTVHDTIIVIQHDTTFVTQTDTVTLTLFDTVTSIIHDTTIVDNYIYDTTLVTDTLLQTDTIWLTDTIYFTESDTVYIDRVDTVYIHDTVYVGVDDVESIQAKVYANQGQVVVEGAEGHTVTLYDVSGRILATKHDDFAPLRFDVPASGAYMIKIGNHPAKKVVVIR